MTRHARNCTAGAVYTYHEKKKDAAASGYGTNMQRVGKDSVKDFDCCCLTLQPCRNPVVTKDGYLFDKEAILEYILTKKREYARKLKEYEKQKLKEREQSQEKTVNEELQKLQNFLKGEKNIISKSQTRSKEANTSVSNMSNGKDKMLPSFWIPSKTPEAKEIQIQKPDKTIYCPISGRPLKVKDLIPIKFTEVKDPDDKKSLIVKQARFMCPITHDVLGNSVPCAVIKTSGDVITMECVEKILKKDWINPLDSSKLKETDIIALQRGGTGYSSVNSSLEGRHERPVLQATCLPNNNFQNNQDSACTISSSKSCTSHNRPTICPPWPTPACPDSIGSTPSTLYCIPFPVPYYPVLQCFPPVPNFLPLQICRTCVPGYHGSKY